MKFERDIKDNSRQKKIYEDSLDYIDTLEKAKIFLEAMRYNNLTYRLTFVYENIPELEKHLTQTQIGELLGISRETVNRIIRKNKLLRIM